MSSSQCVDGASCIRGTCGSITNEAIIGITVGAAAFVALVAVGVMLCCRKKNGAESVVYS